MSTQKGYWLISNRVKELIKTRAEKLKENLSKRGFLKKYKGRLKSNTPESDFWHSGYCVALFDVLRLMERNPDGEH